MANPPNLNPESRAIFAAEFEQFGGAERSLLALSAWLHLHGLVNHLVTYIDHCNLASYASHPVEVVELLPGASRRGALDKVRAIGRYFCGKHDFQPLLSGYQPALHATLAGMRGFHDLMHDTPALFGDQDRRSLAHRLRIGISNRIVGRGLRSGGRTIVTSEFLRGECRRDFGVEAEIARMGGLSGDFAQLNEGNSRSLRDNKQGEGSAELRMLSVCRIEHNKRIDWLLRGLAELEQDASPLSARADWRLDLAGKGALIAELTALAQQLGIGARVHFHGFVPDADLEQMYAEANLFLMPAVQGYGIPAVEALARGIPVLLHRESGVSDVLLDTPWATVLTGGMKQTAAALRVAIDGVLSQKHRGIPAPGLPTEAEWAERVATLCGWA